VVQKNTQEKGLFIITQTEDIKDSKYYIIKVPTPVDKKNRPVLTPLIKASETIGKMLTKGDIVIYESTLYPGATEEDCVPILEQFSSLRFNKDFFVGYSPERINQEIKNVL
jgi:UDP-N-acetyl-D-galactosamine dehydrogenase